MINKNRHTIEELFNIKTNELKRQKGRTHITPHIKNVSFDIYINNEYFTNKYYTFIHNNCGKL